MDGRYIRLIPLIILMLIVATIGVSYGSTSIPFVEVWKIVGNRVLSLDIPLEVGRGLGIVIWKIRVPRVLLALLSGGALSLVGIFMQGVTRNPLSDPYILGISSGASTGAVLAITMGSMGLGIGFGAFMGAMVATGVVLLLCKDDFSGSKLVLTGVAISACFSSVTSLLIHFIKNDGIVRNALFWMSGSLGGAQWKEVPTLTIALLVVGGIGILINKELDLLLVGESQARSVGLNTGKLKLGLVIMASLLTGLVVATTGPIAFIGLIIPHITRMIISSNHRYLIPAGIIMGATLMAGADIVSRVIISPEELPIGIVTSFLGGPFFLWILRRR